MDLNTLILIAPPILLALTLHEFSHAFAAFRLGDDTAKQMGRLSLNPLRHLDLVGTVMIFLVHFGWAKPVPVNGMNLQNPKRDMLWISLAGPVSNMVLALLSGILMRVLVSMGLDAAQMPWIRILYMMLFFSLQINLALAIFNILPIAPLDGSKILFGILPRQYEHWVIPLERYGPLVLLGLIILGHSTNVSILGRIIWPFVGFFTKLFAGITL